MCPNYFGCNYVGTSSGENVLQLGICGLQWLVADFIMERRLHWLGHLCRVSGDKLLLFGELQRKWPYHGTKKHWRDGVLLSDLKAISIDNCYSG